MDVIVSKEDIITIEKLKIISELAPIRERIKTFERKYNCSIEEFKKKLEESEEDFEAWDDYSFLQNLLKLKGILNAFQRKAFKSSLINFINLKDTIK